jgi:hypothetical protein
MDAQRSLFTRVLPCRRRHFLRTKSILPSIVVLLRAVKCDDRWLKINWGNSFLHTNAVNVSMGHTPNRRHIATAASILLEYALQQQHSGWRTV